MDQHFFYIKPNESVSSRFKFMIVEVKVYDSGHRSEVVYDFFVSEYDAITKCEELNVAVK